MHKCKQCGYEFEGNFCPICGTAFATLGAKNEGFQFFNSEFEKEKKQCKVLLMLLKNMDLEFLKERALKVLDLNPENSLAQMIYDCDFRVTMYEDLPFMELEEAPLETYLKTHCGNIDAETCLTFMLALVWEAQNDSRIGEIVKYLLYNVFRLNLDENYLFNLLSLMARAIGDVQRLNAIAYTAKINKVAGVLDMFQGYSYSANSFLSDGRSLKLLAETAYNSRRIIADEFKFQVEQSQLPANKKQELYRMLGDLIDQPEDNMQKSSSSAKRRKQSEKKNTLKGVGISLIVFGAIITFLGFYLNWVLFIMGGAMLIGGAICMNKMKKL